MLQKSGAAKDLALPNPFGSTITAPRQEAKIDFPTDLTSAAREPGPAALGWAPEEQRDP